MSNNNEEHIAEIGICLQNHPPRKQKNSAESQVRWQIFAAPLKCDKRHRVSCLQMLM